MYTPWSVTAGEIPTTSKWNILGTNDAAFNDGTGIADNAIITRHLLDSSVTGAKIASYRVRRQNDTTNITETVAKIQSGWGAMVFGSASWTINETVTFPTAFTNRPIVVVVPGGDQVAGGTIALGNGGNLVHGAQGSKATSVTATNFVVWVFQPSGTNYATGSIVYYHWIAIGD